MHYYIMQKMQSNMPIQYAIKKIKIIKILQKTRPAQPNPIINYFQNCNFRNTFPKKFLTHTK